MLQSTDLQHHTYPHHQTLQHKSVGVTQLSSSHQEVGDHSEVDDTCHTWCGRGCLQTKVIQYKCRWMTVTEITAGFIKSTGCHKMADSCHMAENCISYLFLSIYIQNWNWLKIVAEIWLSPIVDITYLHGQLPKIWLCSILCSIHTNYCFQWFSPESLSISTLWDKQIILVTKISQNSFTLQFVPIIDEYFVHCYRNALWWFCFQIISPNV
jgi:hypothetical protein